MWNGTAISGIIPGMRLCWADKLALGLFAVVAAYLLFIGSIGPNPNAGSADWFGAYAEILWIFARKVFLPLWLALRVIDFLLGGPRRRAGWVTVKPVDHP